MRLNEVGTTVVVCAVSYALANNELNKQYNKILLISHRQFGTSHTPNAPPSLPCSMPFYTLEIQIHNSECDKHSGHHINVTNLLLKTPDH
jgi:hypothetical protein